MATGGGADAGALSEPLIRSVLLLQPPQSPKPGTREAVDWQTINDHHTGMSTRYADELGDNAYAAFNAITEFASHLPENRCVHRDRHSLQRLAGSWLTSFNTASRKPGFRFDAYMAELERSTSEIPKVTG